MGKNKAVLQTGLVLTGGGARAAYQVGVLRAVSEIVPRAEPTPFQVLCGTSAGAINAAALAAYARNFRMGVRRLDRVWRNFRTEHVFRTDFGGIAKSGMHWLLAMMLGGLGKRNPAYLLDRAPLVKLLSRYLPLEDVQHGIDSGVLTALGISASGYSSGESVTFFQGSEALSPWRRARRIGVSTTITIEHLMASSAIPFLFEAVHLNREYFGDGSMRQTAPISPALHLGADRVLIIGVSPPPTARPERHPAHRYPPLAQIAGHVLNSIFLDSLDVDIERLERINRTVGSIPEKRRAAAGVPLRKIETLVISPSRDLGEIAVRHLHSLPRTVRFLLRGVGAANAEGANLLSYLLFEQDYCQELMALGYADARAQSNALAAFMHNEGSNH